MILKGGLLLLTKKFEHNYVGKIIHLKLRGLPPIKVANEDLILIYRPYQEPSGRFTKPNWDKTRPNYAHIERWNEKQPIWLHAEELKVGDYLLTPKFNNSKKPLSISIPVRSHKNNKKFNSVVNPSGDLAWFFGFYIADGSSLGKNSFGLTLAKHDDIKRIIKCIELFGIKPAIKYYNNYTRIVCNSISITSWLKREFGPNAKNKKIPYWLLTWNNREVLKGIMYGDGYRRKDRNSTRLLTSSKILAIQTWWLLTSQNQFPMIREYKRYSGYPNPSQSWEVTWTENPKNHYTTYWKNYYCTPILEIKQENYNESDYSLNFVTN